MNVYETKNIRNVALLGHGGCGKTTFAESILFQTNAINRRGTVEEFNTQSDYNEIEHERGTSVLSTPLFTEYKNIKINIIDTPGYDDYIGEMISSISVVESGLIILNAHGGVEVGTENAWEYAEKYSVPVFFAINKVDMDQADFNDTYEQAKQTFGRNTILLQYPLQIGAGFNTIVDILNQKLLVYPQSGGNPQIKDIPDSEKSKVESLRSELIEAIAETDEELMNRYFENGDLGEKELNDGLRKAFISRQIFPVFTISSKMNIGTDNIIDFITNICPSPDEHVGREDVDGKLIKYDVNSQNSIFVFKLSSEAHLGDMTFFKVCTGKITPGIDLINEQKNTSERLNQIFVMSGKKRIDVPQLNAGDIGSTVRLKVTAVNHTLHDKSFNINYASLKYPNPRIRIAVVPKTKGEEEKVGMGLNNLHQEDPTLIVEHSPELKQIILYAQGELHMAAAKWRLEHRYKVETEFIDPKVPYRETITKQARGFYRHKKQSGGAGQFAEVHMIIEPWSEDAPYFPDVTIRGKELIDLDWGGKLEFVNCIVGGVIDARFMPAILKGVMEKMTNGPLTGCYVRDIRIYVHDGKMHPVDSNEAAFKTAGRMAFKEIFVKADPKILEPIYDVEIKVPEEYVGDVMSDLPSRRGVILGIDVEGRYQKIKAQMPLAELDRYSIALRSMTQARATHSQSFAEYQQVPPNVQMKLIEENKKLQTEEEN